MMWITCCISFSLVWSEILQCFCCWLSLSKLFLLTQTANRYFQSLLSTYLSHMMKNWTNGRTYRALLPFILESEDVQILVVEGSENSGWDFVTWWWFNGIGSLFKLEMNLSANSYHNRYILYKAFLVRLLLYFCDEMLFICIHTVWFPRRLRELLEMNKPTPSDGKLCRYIGLV